MEASEEVKWECKYRKVKVEAKPERRETASSVSRGG